MKKKKLLSSWSVLASVALMGEIKVSLYAWTTKKVMNKAF